MSLIKSGSSESFPFSHSSSRLWSSQSLVTVLLLLGYFSLESVFCSLKSPSSPLSSVGVGTRKHGLVQYEQHKFPKQRKAVKRHICKLCQNEDQHCTLAARHFSQRREKDFRGWVTDFAEFVRKFPNCRGFFFSLRISFFPEFFSLLLLHSVDIGWKSSAARFGEIALKEQFIFFIQESYVASNRKVMEKSNFGKQRPTFDDLKSSLQKFQNNRNRAKRDWGSTIVSCKTILLLFSSRFLVQFRRNLKNEFQIFWLNFCWIFHIQTSYKCFWIVPIKSTSKRLSYLVGCSHEIFPSFAIIFGITVGSGSNFLLCFQTPSTPWKRNMAGKWNSSIRRRWEKLAPNGNVKVTFPKRFNRKPRRDASAISKTSFWDRRRTFEEMEFSEKIAKHTWRNLLKTDANVGRLPRINEFARKVFPIKRSGSSLRKLIFAMRIGEREELFNLKTLFFQMQSELPLSAKFYFLSFQSLSTFRV